MPVALVLSFSKQLCCGSRYVIMLCLNWYWASCNLHSAIWFWSALLLRSLTGTDRSCRGQVNRSALRRLPEKRVSVCVRKHRHRFTGTAYPSRNETNVCHSHTCGCHLLLDCGTAKAQAEDSHQQDLHFCASA